MSKVIAVIGARLNSSRLPGKQLLDLSGKPLIARVFERLSAIREIDKVILATTNDAYNQPLIDWAVANGKEVFAFNGDVNDLVGRVDAVVSKENPDVVVYVCGDSPLIEPTTLSALIRENLILEDSDWVELAQPAQGESIHEGFNVYPLKLWKKIVSISSGSEDREHVGSALRRLRPSIKVRLIQDDSTFSLIQHRLSVDTPSDYVFMKEVYDRWYSNNEDHQIVSLKWLIGQLLKDKSLTRLNDQVRQKKVGERSLSVLLVCQVGRTIGLGHLSRIIELATAMQDQYCAGVKILIQGEPVHKSGLSLLPHVFVNEEANLEKSIQDELKSKVYAAIVFDLHSSQIPDWCEILLKDLGEKGIVRVGIDSMFCYAGPNHLIDLVCFPCFYLKPQIAKQCVPTPVRFGWQYYLIGRQMGCVSRESYANTVLVLTGGGDTMRLGSRLPEKLDAALPIGTSVIWVRGPYAQPPVLPNNPRLYWHVEEAPKSLSDLMSKCGVALTVYGVSLFELFANGIPSVVFSPYAARDDEELAKLAKEEVACVAINEDDAIFNVSLLLKDESEAQRFASRGPQLVDGFGPARLAGDIFALILESSAK